MLDEDACWAAVTTRDKNQDGRFVTGVMTTGIYCRPSCPAKPLRKNVRFFASPAEAEATGLRACQRCRPLAVEGRDPLTERVAALARHLDAHPDAPITLKDLAAVAGLSPFHLQRAFTAVMGVSPKQYHAAARLKAFKHGLRGEAGVLGAVFEAGYGSTSRAYEAANGGLNGGLGMTPSAYRAGGAGEEIAYVVRDTVLGPLMMAATERGVCFVQFGESPDGLAAQLRAEFPNARLDQSDQIGEAHLDTWMTALSEHLAARAPRPDLPLDLRGTAFQVQVWRFLMQVKLGAAVSYSEVAAGAGKPRAVRAAASACAANRIAVLVPCHRAIRGDGGLGGYRWGLERKRALLDAERRVGGADPRKPVA